MNFSKISTFAALIATGIVGFASNPAMAATLATDVYNKDGQLLNGQSRSLEPGENVDPYRLEYNSALGAVDNIFYSMTFNQSLIFGFGGKKFNRVKLWETTLVDREDWAERVEISVGDDLTGTFTKVTDILNDKAMTDYIDVGGMHTYLKITDTTLSLPTTQNVIDDQNGFDIDAIAVESVPEPTSILGLLAVSGLGATLVRKRSKI